MRTCEHNSLGTPPKQQGVGCPPPKLTGLAKPAKEWNLRMPCSALLMTSLWRMLLITSFHTAAKVAHFCVRRSRNSRTNSRGWLCCRRPLGTLAAVAPSAAARRHRRRERSRHVATIEREVGGGGGGEKEGEPRSKEGVPRTDGSHFHGLHKHSAVFNRTEADVFLLVSRLERSMLTTKNKDTHTKFLRIESALKMLDITLALNVIWLASRFAAVDAFPNDTPQSVPPRLRSCWQGDTYRNSVDPPSDKY